MKVLLFPFLLQTINACNILSLSGGGAFGAVEMGILDDVIERNIVPSKYDIITGISAGGLNAGFLSYYDSVSEALPDIQSIYSSLTTSDVYSRDLLGILSEWSIYNNSPLERTLTDILEKKSPSNNTPMTLIGSTNVNTEHLDVFHFNPLNLTDKVNVLMATSSIPFAFPPRKVNGSLYIDGGVISNEMITQALGQIKCDSYNVTFISASSRSPWGQKIYDLSTYVSGVLHLLFRTFDYQLAQITKCSYPKGQIRACFPTSPLLDNYSILDFDNGALLYKLGKMNNTCTTYELCW